MAAQPPLVPVFMFPVPAPGNAFQDEDPVCLPGGHPLVAATGSFLQWQAVAAAPGAPPGAHVSLPFHAFLYAFGTRCKVSSLPADQTAARAINPFTLRLHAAYWSRMLSELCASGLAPPGANYLTTAELHDVIASLPVQNPNLLLIAAADWNPAPALTAPGAGAAHAAARARFDEVSFLAAASIPSLEITTGPRARTAPWAAITLLSGALGPVGRNPLRFSATAPSLIVAAEIRGTNAARDAVLASSLRQVLINSILPPAFRSHSADQASVLAELQAGLRYRLSEDDKAAVEEERIHFIRPRYPTLAAAIIDLGTCEGQIAGVLRILQKAMLPPQLHDARLADTLDRLETQLASRLPTINTVLAQANPTVDDVTSAILAENAVMSQVGAGAVNNVVGGGAPGGGTDADGIALSKQSFKDVEAALGRFDLTSEAGQLDGIASILAPGECVLAIRILLHPDHKRSDSASARNATCVAINSLRPQLYNYFNRTLRMITSGPAPVLPGHMTRYSFATPIAREDSNSLLAHFLRFEVDQMDLFEQPHGAGTWTACVNVSSARETISKVNYFVQLSNVERVKSFVNVLLVAIGLPQALPVGQPGYSWPMFVDFYISKLKLAAGLPLLLDQYEHLDACADLFRAALTAIRHRLTTLIRDPDPSARNLRVPLLPADCAPIEGLSALETEIVRKRHARGDMAGAFRPHEGKPPTALWESLKLDDPFYVDHLKAKAKSKARVGDASDSLTVGTDALETGADEAGLAPGSLTQSYRWMNGCLIISAMCWDVPRLWLNTSRSRLEGRMPHAGLSYSRHASRTTAWLAATKRARPATRMPLRLATPSLTSTALLWQRCSRPRPPLSRSPDSTRFRARAAAKAAVKVKAVAEAEAGVEVVAKKTLPTPPLPSPPARHPLQALPAPRSTP